MPTLWRSRRLHLLTAALLLPLLLVACGGKGGSKEVPANAVALVGDEPITRAAFASMLAADRLNGQPLPAAGTTAFRTERNKLLDQLVQEAELQQHARSQFGIEIDDAQVERQLDALRTRTSAGSESQFKALAQQGLTEARARAQIRQRLLGAAVLDQLSAQASVTDDEIERYYKSHLKGYERPATRRVSHILVRTRAQAEELERKLRSGAAFAALAKRYSIDDTTAASGGVLAGGITRGQTLPAFDRVAFSLKTNAISPPFPTESGWEIIEATSDVTPQKTTPLSAVRSAIEAALLTTKRRNALDRWANETRKTYAERVVYAPGFGPAPQTPSAGRLNLLDARNGRRPAVAPVEGEARALRRDPASHELVRGSAAEDAEAGAGGPSLRHCLDLGDRGERTAHAPRRRDRRPPAALPARRERVRCELAAVRIVERARREEEEEGAGRDAAAPVHRQAGCLPRRELVRLHVPMPVRPEVDVDRARPARDPDVPRPAVGDRRPRGDRRRQAESERESGGARHRLTSSRARC